MKTITPTTWILTATGWQRSDGHGNYYILSQRIGEGVSLDKVQRFIRNNRNFGRAMNDVVRYW